MASAPLQISPTDLALSERTPSRGSRRAALAVFWVSFALFVALVPFAKVKLAAVPLFVPINQTVLIVNDLITVVLLLGQLGLTQSRSVLVLACGYVFSALLALVHMLSFPGAFAPAGLLGAGPQSTAYLYIFWHVGVAAFALAYAYLRRRENAIARDWPWVASAWVCVTVLACAAVAWVALAHDDWFPSVLQGNVYSSSFSAARHGLWVLMGLALAAVWRIRLRSVLDLWVAVTLCGWIFEIGLVAILNAGRFDIGFYAGRVYALLASSCVLVMLLVEQLKLHAELAQARGDVERAATLRELEARFQVMVDAMPQLAWTARADGWIYWYNRRWYDYTGTTPEEMEGWGWQKVHDPSKLALVVERWTTSIRTGEPFEMVFPLRGADGRFREFLTRVVPLRDESGHILQWFGTNTDVTSQVEAEQALREADLRKDEFLATLSHELRNPLAPIRTAVEIAARDSPLPPRASDAIRVLDRQSRHLVRLVDDLLEISRISQGRLQLHLQPVSLNTCIRDAVEAVRASAEAAHQELRVELPPVELVAQADATRITQCVSNLLVNAVKFTPAGGTITVALRQAGGRAEISVADTGIGIPPERIGRIFEKFSQVTPALHRAHGGLGIGLALVKALVAMHHGEASVTSAGAGQGSVFRIVLPVLEARAEAAPAEPQVPPVAARKSRRILVVDDNLDAASLLAESLRMLGHEVREAHNGLECLREAERFGPEVILLDLGMPEMNGYDAARALRASGSKALVVALTGWGQDKDREATRASGFDLHLTKPIDVREVLSIVEAQATA